MFTDKVSARVIGVLFIVASAAAALSQVVLGSLLDDDGYLVGLAADASQVRIGALLDIVTASAVVGIPIVLFPILKRHSETISVGYLVARVLEAVVIVVGALGLLALLALSQDFVASAPADTAPYEMSGSLLLSVRDLTDSLGTQLLFSLTALILYYSFYKTRLVPRFLSVWGLIGALLMLVAGLLGFFGRDPFATASIALAAPLAINEMVLAVWLIIKGFTPASTDPESTLGTTVPRATATSPTTKSFERS